jgi:signal transduction histidine kinase
MKLRTKFVIAVIGVTSLFSLLLGILVMSISFDASINQVSKNIDVFQQQLMNSNEDPVSMALLLGESHSFNIEYFEADSTVTTLIDSFSMDDDKSVISKTIDLGSGEKLVISASIEREIRARDTATSLAVALSLLGGFLSGLISLFILRKDVVAISKLTKEAELVASGSQEEITSKTASAEVTDLSEALSQMTKQLQSSRAQMKVFIGDASHELKTPLTVIRGYLDLLSKHDELSQEKRKVAIERSLSESLRMQQLISDLLQLAELEETPQIEMAPFNFGELIAEHVYDLQTLQTNRKVELFLEGEVNFVGSKTLMSQVLANAFQNIVRYTKERDLVRITLQSFEEKLYLLIEDSGPGIATLHKGRVINSFNRFDESRSRSSGGSGLGLSIMAKIVDVHGGKMELARSELGGLQVAISFPERHAE